MPDGASAPTTMEAITLLAGKHIVLAATGSIAVYKSIDLASKLTQAGAQVDVILTDAAQQFVTPLVFQAVTGRSVYTSMWQPSTGDGLPTHIAHVGLAENADLLAIVPATAHTLAKITAGMADDLVSLTALAARCPILIAPAMDGGMYESPAVQANLEALLRRGIYLIEPEIGRFASGLVGKGRLPETPTLLGHIRRVLGLGGDLAGYRIVVTAGGTREAIDPVRYISNHSSGKQGYAIAQAALDAGAQVTLISSAALPAPVGAHLVSVASAMEMRDAVLTHCGQADVLAMAAAVADFRPLRQAEQKIKKDRNEGTLSLELTRNPDILMDVKAMRERSGYPSLVVGFAAESENLLANAHSKLERKALDLLVANDITAADAGFAVDTNRVMILDMDGGQQTVELTSKARIAEALLQRVAAMLSE